MFPAKVLRNALYAATQHDGNRFMSRGNDIVERLEKRSVNVDYEIGLRAWGKRREKITLVRWKSLNINIVESWNTGEGKKKKKGRMLGELIIG